ncbi:MAG TPA: SMC family ATPase [Candidatus Methylomirabilis sp.]|nr:SMC family ATPase [Candidatus Methylomirabilis sp.]
MTEKFRLESITIEGFKGFTSSQKIDLNGKPTFIFGPNGWGKSSILEAISWCMWGLDRENESEIRNKDFHRGDSRVEISLVRNKEIWKVTRKLRTGSGKSDAKIVSPQGEEKKLTDIFPQLRKLGGIGANVLFSQQGTTHRSVGDLNKFKDVIDAYLGLDRLEKLRILLNDEVTDLKDDHYEKLIKRVWGEFEKSINSKIEIVENKLQDISLNSPWQGAAPPTESQTKRKAVALYKDAGNFFQIPLEDSVPEISVEEILNKIRNILESPHTVGKLDETLKQKKSVKSSLEDMKGKYENILSAIENTKNKCASSDTELCNLLSTETEEGFKKNKESLNKESDNLGLELETACLDHKKAEENRIIRKHAIEIDIQKLNSHLERLSSLETEISRLEKEIEALTVGVSKKELITQLEALKNQVGKLGEYSVLISTTNEYCSKYEYTICPICESDSDFLPKLSIKINAIPQEISSVLKEINSLEERIQNIDGTRSKLIIRKNEKSELDRLIPEYPDQALMRFETEKQGLIQKEEVARIKMEQLSKEIPEKRKNIQNEISSIALILEKVANLRANIQNYRTQLKSSNAEKERIENDFKTKLILSIDKRIELRDFEDAISNIGSEILNLERELTDKTSGMNIYKSRTREIKVEAEYHRLLKLKANLSELKFSEDWQEIEQLISEYLALLDSIEEISKALGNAYTQAFNKHLTAINQKVCEVYKILTAQPSYPDARVSQISSDSETSEIVMEVGISDRDIWRKPTEVLNEQARNAVVLVPYFAFSELGMLQHDLDFLLIDDPSRSFDYKHLKSLMSLLESVSDHAQVVLATHENEKFEEPVRDLFGSKSKILEVEGFEPKSGPKIREVPI